MQYVWANFYPYTVYNILCDITWYKKHCANNLVNPSSQAVSGFSVTRQSSSKLNHKIVLRKRQFCNLPKVTNFLIITINALQSYCHGDAATRKTGQDSFRNGKYDHHLQFRRKYLLFRPKHKKASWTYLFDDEIRTTLWRYHVPNGRRTSLRLDYAAASSVCSLLASPIVCPVVLDKVSKSKAAKPPGSNRIFAHRAKPFAVPSRWFSQVICYFAVPA